LAREERRSEEPGHSVAMGWHTQMDTARLFPLIHNPL